MGGKISSIDDFTIQNIIKFTNYLERLLRHDYNSQEPHWCYPNCLRLDHMIQEQNLRATFTEDYVATQNLARVQYCATTKDSVKVVVAIALCHFLPRFTSLAAARLFVGPVGHSRLGASLRRPFI